MRVSYVSSVWSRTQTRFAPADAAYMVPEESPFCNAVCSVGGEAEAARFDFVTPNIRAASCSSL